MNMTDAELAKAVADACGIEVFRHGEHWFGHDDYPMPFMPLESWDSAMHAAEKCGLFDENQHRAELHRCDG